MSIRYNRQEKIKGWDQSILENSEVVIIGAGALGNHVAPALASMGIGKIRIADFDTIEIHNLNRQFMFDEKDVGKYKAETLANKIKSINSSISVEYRNQRITEDDVDDIIGEPDIVIDCLDNIKTRKIINEYTIEIDIPLIHGGVSWNGWEAGVLTKNTPCINCIYPKKIQEEEEAANASCIYNPDPSVVYMGQMAGAFMVNLLRKVLMALPEDKIEYGVLYKYDERLSEPFYIQKIRRKSDCDLCVPLLEELYPDLYEKEKMKKNNFENIEII